MKRHGGTKPESNLIRQHISYRAAAAETIPLRVYQQRPVQKVCKSPDRNPIGLTTI